MKTKAEAEVCQLLTTIRSKVDENEFNKLMAAALETFEDPPGFLGTLSDETLADCQMSAERMGHRLAGRPYGSFKEFVGAINEEVRVELMAQTIVSLAPAFRPLISAMMRGEVGKE